MSVQALSMAFALRGLSASEKLVLLALANFANDQLQCWPSQDRLADDTELSARTVWAALKSLEGRGVLSRVARKRDDGTRSTDVFTLNFAAQPLAKSAKATRNPCDDQSQLTQDPVAAVATLTTFEPSLEPSSEPLGRAAPKPKVRGSRFVPESWAPTPADFAIADTLGFKAGDLERELTRFRRHEFAKPKSNWSLTFQNWLDKAAERRPSHDRPHNDPRFDAKNANLLRGVRAADAVAGLDWGEP